MNDRLDADEWRVVAAMIAFEDIAADLLRDLEPADESITLFAVALVDAALSGDRPVLEVMSLGLDRLRVYEGEVAPRRARTDGLLEGLQIVCRFAQIALVDEYSHCARGG